MPEKEIHSVEDAIDLVRWGTDRLAGLNEGISNYRDIFPRGTWFRGQENSAWDLVPSVFRRENGKFFYASSEPSIVSDFKLRHANRHAEMSDSFDWLCLMQHHGCPTRILDFTENVLIALYFAVCDNPKEKDSPGALFVLNVVKLNHKTARVANWEEVPWLRAGDFPCWLRSQQSENFTLNAISIEIANSRPGDLPQFKKGMEDEPSNVANYLSRPIAAWPRAIHERMVRQQSVFVVFGGTHAKEGGDIPSPCMLEELDRDLSPSFQFLRKFEIPACDKPLIRRDLQFIGIHIASLFPEMEYQAAFIREAHKARISNPDVNTALKDAD